MQPKPLQFIDSNGKYTSWLHTEAKSAIYDCPWIALFHYQPVVVVVLYILCNCLPRHIVKSSSPPCLVVVGHYDPSD